MREIVDNGGAVFVSCQSGLWQCDIFWEDAAADLALLVLTHQVKAGGSHPTRYPRPADFLPALGMSVGYMARHDTVEKESGREHKMPAFFGGWVSRREPDHENYPRYRLTSSYAINGFSGAPVFLPSEELCAVHVRSVDASVLLEEGRQPIPFIFPEVTPIAPALPSIRAALQRIGGGRQ